MLVFGVYNSNQHEDPDDIDWIDWILDDSWIFAAVFSANFSASSEVTKMSVPTVVGISD